VGKKQEEKKEEKVRKESKEEEINQRTAVISTDFTDKNNNKNEIGTYYIHPKGER
jgi:hypothetical protein